MYNNRRGIVAVQVFFSPLKYHLTTYLNSRKMECIVIVGIMKNATMKGLIAFYFGSFVKSNGLLPKPISHVTAKNIFPEGRYRVRVG